MTDPIPPTSNPALLVVDVQSGLDDPAYGQRNNPGAEATIARLLAAWRQSNRPLFHIQHHSTRPTSPLRPGQPGVEIKPEARPQPGEPVLPKQHNSAFVGTDLESRLHAAAIDAVVVVGLTTDHCVSSTVRMAANLGFRAFLVADATATHERVSHTGQHFSAQQMHDAALASLHGEFATVLDADDLLARLDLNLDPPPTAPEHPR